MNGNWKRLDSPNPTQFIIDLKAVSPVIFMQLKDRFSNNINKNSLDRRYRIDIMELSNSTTFTSLCLNIVFGIYYFTPCVGANVPLNSVLYAEYMNGLPVNTTNLTMRIIDDTNASLVLSNFIRLISSDFKSQMVSEQVVNEQKSLV
jgi:hypothetical protein